ncbi:SPOR domain-containing protein [Wenzhouxiangella sp. AB-CW3]|uniref:SPOR domain-containing protein n=1 Tax=Wenzhouxiangella sp. AB-CW3 TaxID=2771012 RepID=UPI00168AE01A|nr:SPOR domain-containing protein [Wenzhouxiangella sp. AB-CW3]QOC22518.1 SPOR domain-containing protein [Wenzhouxiangella sp. AB-CW3]
MARRQARRGSGGSALNGLMLFGAGVICGLGVATVAWIGGYLPSGSETPPGLPAGHDEPAIAEPEEERRSRQYDFFTVLPEIEVVVPQEEFEERARERPEPEEAAGSNYLLQVASFQSENDAESLRAELTLLGLDARVQAVTVNDATWHRVRVGPFDTAREANSARRRLLDNGHEAMVLSGG